MNEIEFNNENNSSRIEKPQVESGIITKTIMFLSFGLISRLYIANIVMVAISIMLIFLTILNYLPTTKFNTDSVPVENFEEIEFRPEYFFIESFSNKELASFPEEILNKLQRRK